MLHALMLALVATAASDPCAAPRVGDSCSPRNGHCFDLAIDGQRVEPLVDRALREELQAAVSQAVCWRLAQPVAGAAEPVVSANSRTESGLQGLREGVEMVVIPLQGQEIPTRKGVRTDPTVLIGGVPMQTVVDVIDTEALPGGAYVITFRVRGQRGWDRKAVYVEVAREPW
ncbi:MAG TPA: hypothetical protein PKZ76_14090 [Xanthomonadaceae bacterium]|nr:hypothetical protein [Xanthomonadaceae bacterium]